MQQNPYAAPNAPYEPAPQDPPLLPPSAISVWQAVRFSFADVGFVNLLIGLLLLFVPFVGGLLLMGWIAETHRRLALRLAPPVRAFKFAEFMNYVMAGIPVFAGQMAVMFITMIPVFIVMGAVGAIAATSRGEPGPVAIAAMIVAAVLFVVLMLVVTVFGTTLTIRGELSGSLKETFHLEGIMALSRRHWGKILVHTFVLTLFLIPLSLLGMLAFFVGIYVVAIATQFAAAHLRWQIYERDIAMGGAPIPIRIEPGADL